MINMNEMCQNCLQYSQHTIWRTTCTKHWLLFYHKKTKIKPNEMHFTNNQNTFILSFRGYKQTTIVNTDLTRFIQIEFILSVGFFMFYLIRSFISLNSLLVFEWKILFFNFRFIYTKMAVADVTVCMKVTCLEMN